ncbi:MAG: hypothetical protein LBI78_07520 [Campylobacteraceae bacterium]|jgi:hypothetical protein|nr:hypothetical protein [Campylobacteraceae bacterium]
MNTIKFSHRYPKLHEQTYAELLKVYLIDLPKDMNERLYEYDTAYRNSKGLKQHYKLSDGEYIQLVFCGNYHIPFCTIRKRFNYRYCNYDKFAFYNSKIGQRFNIEVEEKK